jgi:predicted N-acetyltransferase YhbS
MTHPRFTLRPILAEDAPAVADLIRATFASILPPLVPPPSAVRETAESVASQIAEGGGAVAEGADGVMIGAVLWGEREGGLYLGRLSVSAAARRWGVARALVLAGEAVAQERGLPRVHVGVRLVLAGNRRLFAGLGFCETNLHTHDGFDAPTWVEMEKRFG